MGGGGRGLCWREEVGVWLISIESFWEWHRHRCKMTGVLSFCHLDTSTEKSYIRIRRVPDSKRVIFPPLGMHFHLLSKLYHNVPILCSTFTCNQSRRTPIQWITALSVTYLLDQLDSGAFSKVTRQLPNVWLCIIMIWIQGGAISSSHNSLSHHPRRGGLFKR